MNIYSTISELIEHNRAIVIVTVVETVGSTPGKTNFKAVVDSTGLIAGTVGGGKIEALAIEEARSLLSEKRNLLKSYNLTSGPDNIGMTCGGSVTLFYEFIRPRERVIVCGGGHVSQKLTPLLRSIGFYVTLVEDRKEFATPALHPEVDEFVISAYGDYVRQGAIDEETILLIVTPAHKNDLDILTALFQTSLMPKYIGVIASKRKAITMREELEAIFPGDPRIGKIEAPMGLDIGGETPAQIALSIAARLQALKFGKMV